MHTILLMSICNYKLKRILTRNLLKLQLERNKMWVYLKNANKMEGPYLKIHLMFLKSDY